MNHPKPSGAILAALDARMIAHSGIGTHIRGLLEGIAALDRQRDVALLGPSWLLASVPQAQGFHHIEWNARIYSLSEQVSCPHRMLRRLGIGILHSPHYNVPLIAGGLRRGVTIHDAIHLTHAPSLHPLKRAYARLMLGRAARSCQLLCTVSSYTAFELQRLFGVDASSIVVLPNAPARAFRKPVPQQEAAQAAAAHGLRAGEYLLTVGINKPHKNYPFVVRSLASLFQQQRFSYDLAMVGITPQEAAPLLELAGSYARYIRVLGKLPFEELPRIYAGARALVFPSLAEGFGLPVVEAQGLGVPVLAARAASIPEVAGHGAILFDPTSSEDFQRAIAELPGIDTPEWYELRQRGFENARRFDWATTAQVLLTAWERMG